MKSFMKVSCLLLIDTSTSQTSGLLQFLWECVCNSIFDMLYNEFLLTFDSVHVEYFNDLGEVKNRGK